MNTPKPTQCTKLPLELKLVSVSPGKLVGTQFKRVDLIDKSNSLDPKQMTLPSLLTTPLSRVITKVPDGGVTANRVSCQGSFLRGYAG